MDISRYLAEEGKKIDLTQWSTTCDVDIDKKKVKGELLDQTISEMQDLQEKLCADNHYGLIIVLQAMDAAGKDGTVKHVFAHLNPAGVKVHSFKKPSSEELDHDYMWRINKALPGRVKSASSTARTMKKSSSPASTTSSKATVCRKNWYARISGKRATARYATGNGTCRKMASLWSRSSSIYRKMNRRNASSTAS